MALALALALTLALELAQAAVFLQLPLEDRTGLWCYIIKRKLNPTCVLCAKPTQRHKSLLSAAKYTNA
jgi:hypothetical protein